MSTELKFPMEFVFRGGRPDFSRLESIHDLRDWARLEADRWKGVVFGELGGITLNAPGKIIFDEPAADLAAIERVVSGERDPADIARIAEIPSLYARGKRFAAQTRLGEHVLQAFATDRPMATVLICILAERLADRRGPETPEFIAAVARARDELARWEKEFSLQIPPVRPATSTLIQPPLQIDLGQNGGPVSISTYEEIRNWANQVTSWTLQYFRAPLSSDRQIKFILDQQDEPAAIIGAEATAVIELRAQLQGGEVRTELSEIAAREADHRHKIEEAMRRFASMKAVHPSGLLGARCQDIASREPWAGCGALAGAMAVDLTGIAHGEGVHIARVFQAYVAIRAQFPELVANAVVNVPTSMTGEIARLATVAADDARAIARKKAEADDVVTTTKSAATAAKDDAEKFLQTSQAKLAALERAYADQLNLKEPAQYWSLKADDHLDVVIGAAFAFLIVGALAWMEIPQHLPGFVKALQDADGKLSGAAFGILVIPAILLLSVLGLVWRVLSLNLDGFRDAKERAVMAQTYISYSTSPNNPLTDNHKTMILSLLFTPTGASPTAALPHVELLNAVKELKT